MCSVVSSVGRLRLPERNERFHLYPGSLPGLNEAQAVHLAFEHEGWVPKYALTRNREGHWDCTVLLAQGARHYAFLITDAAGQTHNHLDPRAAEVDVELGGEYYKASLRIVSGF